MDKLTANIIKDQMIGETNGHMAAIPNNPILFSIFKVYQNTSIETDRDYCFNIFIKELSDSFNPKGE